MTILVEKAEIASKKYKLILFEFTVIFSTVRLLMFTPYNKFYFFAPIFNNII